MNKIAAALLLVAAMAWASPGSAEVIFVESGEQGADPTPTFFWPGRESKAVLIMIPGGEGHIGLTAERTDLGGFYGATLKPLSDPASTSGRLDVVVFDSPDRLLSGESYPQSRASSDHLRRIESVVRHYKETLHKPVWLMGHSNGAASVTEFWRNIHDGPKKTLIEGLIVSSSRNGISFPDDTDIPVLFLNHQKDGCAKSSPRVTMGVYESLRSSDKNKVDFVWINGGEAEAKNPCFSGYHMYFGAGDEAAKAIDRFITSAGS